MKTKIWIALIALYFVWGSTYLAIRFAVETLPPFLHASLRFLISGVVLYVWRRAAGDPTPTLSNWKSTAVVGILLLLGGNGLVALAEKEIPSGIAALIISTSPFWLVMFEALRARGTRPSWQAILGLIIGFGGVFLLIGPAEITGAKGNLDSFSTVVLLIAAILWSTGSIYSRGADMPKSTLLSTGMQMLVGSAALFIVSVAAGELNGFSFTSVSMRSWLGLAYLIAIGSLVGFVSYGWLLQNAPISLTSTYAYVNPVVAVLLGYWIGDEALGPRIWIAAAIIISSVFLINYSKRSARVRPSPEEVAPVNQEVG